MKHIGLGEIECLPIKYNKLIPRIIIELVNKKKVSDSYRF